MRGISEVWATTTRSLASVRTGVGVSLTETSAQRDRRTHVIYYFCCTLGLHSTRRRDNVLVSGLVTYRMACFRHSIAHHWKWQRGVWYRGTAVLVQFLGSIDVHCYCFHITP